jgi:hypothetical protein
MSSENWISHNSGQISTYNTIQYLKINVNVLYYVVKVTENEGEDVMSKCFHHNKNNKCLHTN